MQEHNLTSESFRYKKFKWFMIYALIGINMIAALMIYDSGSLLSSYSATHFTSLNDLLITLLILVIVIIIILGGHDMRPQRKIYAIGYTDRRYLPFFGKWINLFTVFWQLLFLLYCLYFNVNIVGSVGDNASPIKYLFFLLPADMIFIVSYAFHRSDKYFSISAILYLLSNVLRGWTGPILLFLIIEGYYLFYKNKKRFYSYLLLLLLIYPFILFLKWTIRSQGQFDFIGVVNGLDYKSYFDFIIYGIKHVIIRIETISASIGAIMIVEEASDFIEAGLAYPMWQENMIGLVFNSLLTDVRPLSLTTLALDTHIFDATEMSVGSSSISIPFHVYAILGSTFDFILSIIFIIFLYVTIIFLVYSINKSVQSQLVVFYILFAFLLPGWVGSVFYFIYVVMGYGLIRLFSWALIKSVIFPKINTQ
jgi:hypothetical protein